MFKEYSYKEIDNVAFELLNGKVAIIPTDTIIGILSKDLHLIYTIKNRSRTKKIIIFLPNISYLKDLTTNQQKFLDQFWPGQVTIIKNNVSYRIPNDKYLLYLLNKIGPLYCSSANLSGEETITNTHQANQVFNNKKLFDNIIVVQGESHNSLPSTIIDIDKWEILREGERVNEVKEFINKLKLQDRKITILLDKSIWIKNKKFKNIHDGNIKVAHLNSHNFHSALNEIDDKQNNDLLIVTNEPLHFDQLANKHKYARSGIAYDNEVVPLLKKHDNTNVVMFDLNLFDLDEIEKQIKIYLNEEFEGGRHQDRVQTIINYENENN